MRDSIGGAWLFGLIVTFILLFTAFLAVTINYTKAFRVKNEVVNFIEREEGLTDRTSPDDGAIQLIANYLNRTSQTATGKCPNDYIGVFELEGNITYEMARSDRDYFYCVKKFDSFDQNEVHKAYYDVMLFFEFDLPVFGDLFKFGVSGETTQIQYPADCRVWLKC